ncbi:hypothetical protein F2Q69_00035375 [Brassica cretica]|uniref:Uncharacterized protein n=1 Tax=Brassica cretica TaxID=69181 RepID=A0A8S9SCP8_BRACR|nr:hypothetical protein F2Q69_00035375 [Brassica cretica]
MFQAMEANNEFVATLERRLQDVPRSDELYEIKKVVREMKLGLKMAQDRERANAAQLAAAEKLGNQAASLEARSRVMSNKRKSALEEVSFLEAKVESSANKFSGDLRCATYDAKKALADSYLDVLISLEEKWEKKKAATYFEARLRELDVMAVSDFSVEKLDLPQILEDLPEDFFAKVPSMVNGTGDATKRAGGQFEDVFAALVGGAGCNQRLDQGLGLQSAVKNIAILGYKKSIKLEQRSRLSDSYAVFGSSLICFDRVNRVAKFRASVGKVYSFFAFVFADSGHLMLSLEVGDFPKGRPRIWVVSSNARRRSSFIEVLCVLFLRDLQVLSLRIRVDGSAGVVTLILPYWVTETRLLNGSRSRWSLILGCQSGFYFVQPAVTQASLGHALLRRSLRVLSHAASGSSARDLWSTEGSGILRI